MSKKILLVGSQSESINEIKNLLVTNEFYKILEASNFQEALQKLAANKPQLLVYDTDLLTEEKVGFLRNLRGLGYPTPLLMLARAVAPRARQLVSSSYSRAIILEKPFANRHFMGVATKLLDGRDVAPQTHKRFYTNQETIVEQIGKNKKYICSMLNLSKGGAYLEIPDPSAEFSGIIKMKVHLNEIDKEYEVNARVVWNSKESIWGRGQGVGVEFIQAKDVYRNLLNNL